MPRLLRFALSITVAALLSQALPAVQANAAQPAGSLVIVTQTPNPTTAAFSFALTPAAVTGETTTSITGAGSVTLAYAATSRLRITESIPPSFGPVTISCMLNGGTTGVATNRSIRNVTIAPNQVTTCTFTQTARPARVRAAVSFAPSSVGHLGGTTVETWSVTNPSGFPVTLTSVSESWLGDLSAPGCEAGTVLAPGTSCGGTISQWVSQPAGGTATRTVTATVVSAAGATATNSASARLRFLLPSSAVQVSREVSPSVLPSSGGWASLKITLTNPGASSITAGSFVDTQFGEWFDGWVGNESCHAGTVLAPGESCAIQTQAWFSGAAGTTMTATAWNVATSSTGVAVLGEGSSTLTLS
jgi:hypothetical protein